VPEGALRVVIQEDAIRAGDRITIKEGMDMGAHVRARGQDFRVGDTVGPRRMRPADLALLASMNIPEVMVARRPVVAIIPTGDELVQPGETPRDDQIIASNAHALKAMAEAEGAKVRLLPIARDNVAALGTVLGLAEGADLIVTIGGASVGDHDLVGKTPGLEHSFWKIAMRPGKPLMFGGMEDMLALGLPGNPASAVVCAHIFLLPLIAALAGEASPLRDRTQSGILGRDLPENDLRAEYMRASLAEGPDGRPVLTPFRAQDSSLTHVLAAAEALVFRAAHAPAAKAGDACRWLTLE
jgi:molybdopterin molybdotransferase